MLESAMEAGLSAAGMDVSLVGPMPTPGIAYLTRTSRASAGVVISASHNPFYDNGIKFFSTDGYKMPDDVENNIEELMAAELDVVDAGALGKARRFEDAAGRYIEFCKGTFPADMALRGTRIALDCANGAAYHVAPAVFAELGADVDSIGVQPDGFNINLDSGSTNIEPLRQRVLGGGADLGIAFDGDADRVIMVDHNARVIDGDMIMYVLAGSRLRSGTYEGGIVGTLMSNLGLELACTEMGFEFVRAAVGDRYVMNELRNRNWNLGGESSGHIICLDKTTTGDGIVAALQVLSEIAATGKTLSELVSGMAVFPQLMINVDLSRSGNIAIDEVCNSANVERAVKHARKALGDRGRVLLRASGTEPVIRVMVEGEDDASVVDLCNQVAEAVRQVI
jgi:phosphoglucosamine mutase